METMNDAQLKEYFKTQARQPEDREAFVRRVMKKLPKKREHRARNVVLLFIGIAACITIVLFGWTLPQLLLAIPQGIEQCALPLAVILILWGLFIVLFEQTWQVLKDD